MTAVKPTLESFDRVLEWLACDPNTDVHSPDWIRHMRVHGGQKARLLEYILKRLPSNEEPRCLLDVGAQVGAFALYAARHGYKVSAVDYGFFAEAYGEVLASGGVDYRTCDLGSQPLPFPADSFDAVTYIDVIEHHSFSPKRVLREIYRVLRPNGLILVSTPNHASIYNRLLLLFGKSVNDDFDSYFSAGDGQPTYLGHHREYTRGELRRALEGTGFKVKECRVIEEDVTSLLRVLRRSTLRDIVADLRALVVRALGNIWSTLGLPFGRILWAVGEKPSA